KASHLRGDSAPANRSSVSLTTWQLHGHPNEFEKVAADNRLADRAPATRRLISLSSRQAVTRRDRRSATLSARARNRRIESPVRRVVTPPNLPTSPITPLIRGINPIHS